jgi:hypothetical protein
VITIHLSYLAKQSHNLTCVVHGELLLSYVPRHYAIILDVLDFKFLVSATEREVTDNFVTQCWRVKGKTADAVIAPIAGK